MRRWVPKNQTQPCDQHEPPLKKWLLSTFQQHRGWIPLPKQKNNTGSLPSLKAFDSCLPESQKGTFHFNCAQFIHCKLLPSSRSLLPPLRLWPTPPTSCHKPTTCQVPRIQRNLKHCQGFVSRAYQNKIKRRCVPWNAEMWHSLGKRLIDSFA